MNMRKKAAFEDKWTWIFSPLPTLRVKEEDCGEEGDDDDDGYWMNGIYKTSIGEGNLISLTSKLIGRVRNNNICPT